MRLVQEAQPLLQQSIKLVGELTPLLTQLSEGGVASNLEALTETAAAAAADIQKLQVREKGQGTRICMEKECQDPYRVRNMC